MVKLVGILNVTPDSFSDGGQFFKTKAALDHAYKLFKDGADLVDVGAESTRPGALQLSAEEEWGRLGEILSKLTKTYPNKISLDTYHPESVHQAFKIGPVIVNDVTGMNNDDMVKAVVKHNAECIVSYLSGSDIQSAHQLTPTTSVQQVVDGLLSKEKLLISRGLSKTKIILDPGIGFGKTPALNKELLEFAKYLPGHSIMIGYSRKRFLGEHRMEIEPNLAAAKIAIAAGADYLRVHDVLAHKQLIDSLNGTSK